MYPTQSSLFCVDNYVNNLSFCISYDSFVYSFGKSSNGSHGHSTEEIVYPKKIQHLSNIKYICCGFDHTICVDYNGNTFSFGSNGKGQLGKDPKELNHSHEPHKLDLPPIKQASCGYYFSFFVSEDGLVYMVGCICGGDIYFTPFQIAELNNVEYIVCGGEHVICKTYDYNFYSWGRNAYGQCGQGNSECNENQGYQSSNKPIQCLNWPDNIIDIKCGYIHSLLLTGEGNVYSFGSNLYNQLSQNFVLNDKKLNIPTLIKDLPVIKRIECGSFQSLCIDNDNNLWMVGSNTSGQLGINEKSITKATINPSLKNIIDISAGGLHTFVKTIDNKIYAFGNNEESQLGIQTSEKKQSLPIQVFIDNEDIWCSTIGKSRQKSARK